MAAPGTPVVFVHGLWLHADSWGNWVELFREAGYEPTAPGWPGDGSTVAETRSRPEAVAGHGVDAEVIEERFTIAGEAQSYGERSVGRCRRSPGSRPSRS